MHPRRLATWRARPRSVRRRRHDRATARLPLVLYSSDTPPEVLAEHARTPWAANGYLAMPLDTTALSKLAGRLLAAAEVVESADDVSRLVTTELRPGQTVTFTVVRGKKRTTVDVTLVDRPG